jgi:hypothetical protein
VVYQCVRVLFLTEPARGYIGDILPATHDTTARDMGMAQKAKECAAVLIQMYADRKNPFILTKKEFKAISGKGKMPHSIGFSGG